MLGQIISVCGLKAPFVFQVAAQVNVCASTRQAMLGLGRVRLAQNYTFHQVMVILLELTVRQEVYTLR